LWSSNMLTDPLILVLSIVMTTGDATSAPRTADEVVARMIAHDNERQAKLHGYTAIRRYVLENRSHHEQAEMLVRMICREDGSKQFEVVSETGWGGARKYVFPRLLEAETEAACPDLRERSRITPENYTFEMAGTECVRGRPAYVIEMEPKTPNKYLVRSWTLMNTPLFELTVSRRKILRSGSRVFTSFTTTTSVVHSGSLY
jgi:hypothetical protein